MSLAGLHLLRPSERPTPKALPLDTSDPATLERWVDAPAHDTRTLEEFAAQGGSRLPPPDSGTEFRRTAPTGNRGTR